MAIPVVVGCAGSLDDPERFLVGTDAGAGAPNACESVAAVEAELLVARCAGAVCHDADSPAGGVDLESASPGPRLVDVASSCNGRLLVDTSNVDASYLLEKLRPDPECGSAMPLGGTPLTDSEIACVLAWIGGL